MLHERRGVRIEPSRDPILGDPGMPQPADANRASVSFQPGALARRPETVSATMLARASSLPGSGFSDTRSRGDLLRQPEPKPQPPNAAPLGRARSHLVYLGCRIVHQINPATASIATRSG
jgi:hypothetical protein